MDQLFGAKQMYQVAFKARADMSFGSRKVVKGEPLVYFNDVELVTATQKVKPVMARGGKKNMPQVIWEDNEEVQFSLVDGVISSIGLALLTNANLLSAPKHGEPIIHKQEDVLLDSNGDAELENAPIITSPIFCFLLDNGIIQTKITHTGINDKVISFGSANADKEVSVDYYFYYGDPIDLYVLGKERFNGLLSIEGKFYASGEEDGLKRTGLITLPKVKIISNLNLKLGNVGEPMVSSFNVVSMPDKTPNSDSAVMEILMLDRDIG